MPELPDVTVYVEALQARVQDARLERVRIASLFLLRSADPPLRSAEGRQVVGVRRLGKRIVICLEDDLFLALHLMIAGRLHWKAERGAKVPGRMGLAAFDFSTGSLILTEAGTRRRAALHLARGDMALETLDRGGLEVMDGSLEAFRSALTRESHTLKRSLTDPATMSGIGNAYSDEILHRAKLSPVRLTRTLSEEEIARLYEATRATLSEWVQRLRAETGERFPENVTAFRPGMAVHGRFGQPCPVCGTSVQRIVHAENACNYCPTCQTGGKLLADRALSRLLKRDWPHSIEELERVRERARSTLYPA